MGQNSGRNPGVHKVHAVNKNREVFISLAAGAHGNPRLHVLYSWTRIARVRLGKSMLSFPMILLLKPSLLVGSIQWNPWEED